MDVNYPVTERKEQHKIIYHMPAWCKCKKWILFIIAFIMLIIGFVMYRKFSAPKIFVHLDLPQFDIHEMSDIVPIPYSN